MPEFSCNGETTGNAYRRDYFIVGMMKYDAFSFIT